MDFQSTYQDQNIRIPTFPPTDSSVNFIGRLAQEILRVTDYRQTTFVEQMSAWYDKRTNQELVTLKLWQQLQVRIEKHTLYTLYRTIEYITCTYTCIIPHVHVHVCST